MQATAGNSTTCTDIANKLATFSSGVAIKLRTVPLSIIINGPVDGKNLCQTYSSCTPVASLPDNPGKMGSISSGKENSQNGGRLHRQCPWSSTQRVSRTIYK